MSLLNALLQKKARRDITELLSVLSILSHTPSEETQAQSKSSSFNEAMFTCQDKISTFIE